MEKIYIFIITFLIVFIIYQLFFILPRWKYKKKEKKGKIKKVKKELIEIRYLITKYHLDIEKVNYNKLLRIVGLVSSFDITIIVCIVVFVRNYLLALLLALVIVIPVILVSYHFVGVYYKKKGMIKDVWF